MIDILGLKVRVVLGEHGGDLTRKTIEVYCSLVEGSDQLIVGILADSGIERVSRTEGEVALQKFVLGSHQFCGLLDDCAGSGEEVPDFRGGQVVDEVDQAEKTRMKIHLKYFS